MDVDKALGDATKVTAKGPGIEPVGNVANKPTYFDIYTAGQNSATIKIYKSPHKSGTLASSSGQDPEPSHFKIGEKPQVC